MTLPCLCMDRGLSALQGGLVTQGQQYQRIDALVDFTLFFSECRFGGSQILTYYVVSSVLEVI